MKKSYEHTRVIKHLSLNLERDKHRIDWFERNKGKASVLIKQWIDKEIENEKPSN